MKIFSKLDFYFTLNLFSAGWRAAVSLFSVPKTYPSHPAHSTQPFLQMWLPSIQGSETPTPTLEILKPLWITRLLKKWSKLWALSPEKKNWPNYTHQIIHNLRELAPGSQCPCNSEGLTGSDPHYWLMLNWLTTETQLRISAKANLSSPHIC